MTRWTDLEKALLLASIDTCIARGIEPKDAIVPLMEEHNYHRTFSQIRGQMSDIYRAYSRSKNGKPKTLTSQGTASLRLPEEMMTKVTAAQARIDSHQRSEAEQDQDTSDEEVNNVDDTAQTQAFQTSKKRARSPDDIDNSPRKRASAIACDESRDEDPNATEDIDDAATDDDKAEADNTGYCFCQRVFNPNDDDMIECEDDTCSYKWFHLKCVGVNEIPASQWFCPDCERRRTHPEETPSNEHITEPETGTVFETQGGEPVEQVANPPAKTTPTNRTASDDDQVKTLKATILALQSRVESLETELEMTNVQHVAENRRLFQGLRDRRAKLDEDLCRRHDYTKRETMVAQEALSEKNQILTQQLINLKERFKDMESLQKDKVRIMQEKHRETEDMLCKEIEILKKHASKSDDVYQQQIDAFRREYENQQTIYEEENAQWKTYGIQQRKDWMQLTGGNYLKRVTERWPVEFDLHCLRADWEQSWRNFGIIFSTALRLEDFQMDPVPETLTEFGSLLHRVCGLAKSGEPVNVSQCFQGVSHIPSDHRVIESLIIADLLEWCFTTSFHTHGMASQKLDQLWESIAHYGGLQELRIHDRLSITRRASDEYFNTEELPHMAAKQARRILDKFAGFFPQNDDTIYNRLRDLLKVLMKIKLDLLVGDETYKLAYIPPGTSFDPAHMTAVNADRHPQMISHSDAWRFRTTLCLYPSLAVMKEDRLPERGQGSVDNYRDVLAENRKFFPEIAGQYKDWRQGDPITLAKAVVIVEEIPQQGRVSSPERETFFHEGRESSPERETILHEGGKSSHEREKILHESHETSKSEDALQEGRPLDLDAYMREIAYESPRQPMNPPAQTSGQPQMDGESRPRVFSYAAIFGTQPG